MPVVARTWGRRKKTFLELQPGTVLLLVDPVGMLLGTRRCQRWMLARSDASRNRTLPGWQRWMLAPSDASGNRTLPGWQRWMLGPSDASGTGRYRVGSGGCPPHRMLLGTRCYQVGSGGCSPHRMLHEQD